MITCAGQIGKIISNTVMGKFLYSFGIACVVFLMAGHDAYAQAPDSTITAAIDDFFEAMRTGDTATLARILPAEARMESVTEQEGRVEVAGGDRDRFLATVAQLSGRINEEVDDFRIQQDGPLAMAWMSYRFFLDGEAHHCGTNLMVLKQIGEQWQVHYVIDTRKECL